ncbi:MAG: hypothetical protein M0014_14750 [Actinomycetota bacterium]|jgi:hypothetical protein|nr:hypothetical protein [Actinomycetota bacterium]
MLSRNELRAPRRPAGTAERPHGLGQCTRPSSAGERLVKKGRHRRFEEARSLKRAVEVVVEPCPECGADPEDEHASWCLYESEDYEEADEDGAPE